MKQGHTAGGEERREHSRTGLEASGSHYVNRCYSSRLSFHAAQHQEIIQGAIAVTSM